MRALLIAIPLVLYPALTEGNLCEWKAPDSWCLEDQSCAAVDPTIDITLNNTGCDCAISVDITGVFLTCRVGECTTNPGNYSGSVSFTSTPGGINETASAVALPTSYVIMVDDFMDCDQEYDFVFDSRCKCVDVNDPSVIHCSEGDSKTLTATCAPGCLPPGVLVYSYGECP